MNVSTPSIVLLMTSNTGRWGRHNPMEFDGFYRENYSRIYRTMILAFRDPIFSEEITQEAFYRALRRWAKVSKLEPPRCVDDGRCPQLRERRFSAAKASRSKRTTTDPECFGAGQRGGRGDDQMAVVELLASVSSRQREVLVLRYIAQLSVAEIAVAMKCAEGTVKSTLHAALARRVK